jgi:hypothetical protein
MTREEALSRASELAEVQPAPEASGRPWRLVLRGLAYTPCFHSQEEALAFFAPLSVSSPDAPRTRCLKGWQEAGAPDWTGWGPVARRQVRRPRGTARSRPHTQRGERTMTLHLLTALTLCSASACGGRSLARSSTA